MKVVPVILSGGAGIRLWPLSRLCRPKQLLPLTSARTPLQETVARVGDRMRFAPPLVLCNEEHRFVVAEQLRGAGVEAAAPGAIVLEPVGRSTAAAAAVAALLAAAEDPAAALVLLPTDHHIGAPERLVEALRTALPAAAAGLLVAFGVPAVRLETGYGYIRPGPALAAASGAQRIEAFVEKPDEETARRLVADGRHLWNTGIFLFRADAYLAELERLDGAVVTAARAAVAAASRDHDFVRLDREAFAAAPNRSVDHAVMERTDLGAVVPVDMAWSDLGSWASLWEVGAKTADGNVLIGDVVVSGVRNSYVRGQHRLVAAAGLDGVVLVETPDAVLAAGRADAQAVRAIVERLEADGRTERLHHRRVERPWGSYEPVDAGPGYQVKRIVVEAGGRLSLQKHAHRSEHWIMVRGVGCVTCGDRVFDLAENQSTLIPAGAVHRLENRSDAPLHMIEVQVGDYLGEDDIVRLEDVYGRT